MPERGVLLGFDYGSRRIGVAIGQTLTGQARALVVLKSHNERPDWAAIGRLLAEWNPRALVVGLPLQMGGEEQAMTARARRFGNQLAGRYNLPVHHAEERLSSWAASRLLAEQGRAGEADDALAAQIILQGWLDERGV
jgi:putative Holliday junction resolvase